MFVEEIVVDNWKSWNGRTKLGPFDSTFTAITGTNGSGKSNIFDAILFVLGSTEWRLMRVDGPQGLVHRAGASGAARKCSVTIIFNNEDKSNSPIGYEKFDQITVTRQIMIGGTSKFLINGHNATLKRVKDLFRSVQLNIKNPHFLIMQGRITKVLNMKPPEILGMIEEVAGTKMYDDKREEAIKEIEKKERKVDEIKRILTNEINPTLSHLKKQKMQYVSWLEGKRDYERLEKFRVAYQFVQAEAQLKSSLQELEAIDKQIAQVESSRKEKERRISELKSQVQDLHRLREKRMNEGDMASLEENVQNLEKKFVSYETANKLLEETREQLEGQIVQTVSSTEALNDKIKESENRLTKQQEKLQTLESRRDEKKEHIEQLKRQLQAIAVGVAADDGKTLADLLMFAKKEQTVAETEIKTATARAKGVEKELSQMQKEVKASDGTYKKLKSQEEQLEKEVKELQSQLAALGVTEGSFDELEVRAKGTTRRVADLKATVQSLRVRLDHVVGFRYKNPSANFDTSRIHGRVAQLVRIADSKYATALDVAAGPQLYSVVVDTEETGASLLNHGELKSRTTFIPLNKIQAKTLNPTQIDAASQLAGPGQVSPALNLVSTNKENQPAISFVFGKSLVCDTSETAKAVTFHPQVKARSVTLEGDVFEPAGTLTGGSRPAGRPVLEAVRELQHAESDLAAAEAELANLTAQLNKSRTSRDKHAKLTQQLDLKMQELDHLRQRIQATDFFQAQAQLESLAQQLQQEKANVELYQKKKSEAVEKVKQIEMQIKNFNKESQLKKTEKDIAAAKKSYESLVTDVNAAQEECVTTESEIAESKDEITELQEKRTELEQELKEHNSKVAAQKEKLEKVREMLKDQTQKLEASRSHFASTDDQIHNLSREREQMIALIEEEDINIKKWAHQRTNLQQTTERTKAAAEQLVEKYPWILQEQQFFGTPHSEYDFSARDIEDVTSRLSELHETQETLGKLINKKAVNMFEAAQQEYTILIEKKTQAEADRKKIEQFISKLDQKKQDTILETYTKVNKDFGVMFGQLLPGTSARLEPLEGQTIFEGLRVQVVLGGVVKESLSELSGGQRSLLALALVLALLVFKPAPMYILDEIDAALDLSHTQNIGELIKTHFKQAQFIIVSLKEGMFNNANVLFRIKNVNGSSQATRIDNRASTSKSKRIRDDEGDRENKRQRVNH